MSHAILNYFMDAFFFKQVATILRIETFYTFILSMNIQVVLFLREEIWRACGVNNNKFILFEANRDYLWGNIALNSKNL